MPRLVPEGFPVHVLFSDAPVGESLVPGWVQAVVYRSGLQLVGLWGAEQGRRVFFLQGASPAAPTEPLLLCSSVNGH